IFDANLKGSVELFTNKRFDGFVKASVSIEGKAVTSVENEMGSKSCLFSIKIENPVLWSIESPSLYDIEFSVGDDTVKSYFGMRKVSIKGNAIEINNKPVFQRLVLDQGYYPDGIYTAPSDEDLKRDIVLSKAVGFNGARLHMKVFEPRTSYWADKLGYILWGEYPNWGCDEGNPAALLSVLPEWLEAVERDYNSPAIVGWCPFNETGSNPKRAITFRTLYNVTRAIDPMRPIIDTSGYTHVITDVYDVHDYDQNPETFRARYMPLVTGEGQVFVNNRDVEKYEGQPYFVSEFGGTHWDIDSDGSQGWGYGKRPEDIEEVYSRIEGLIKALLENPKVCAFCYTQLTDVMQEKNGMYSFDRRPKFDNERLHKVLSAKAAIEE
ncbi:MAG: beta-galactosidase, partial [Clostridia bacterium]|nr:beta-galactosidase [Clostridia bacterium]